MAPVGFIPSSLAMLALYSAISLQRGMLARSAFGSTAGAFAQALGGGPLFVEQWWRSRLALLPLAVLIPLPAGLQLPFLLGFQPLFLVVATLDPWIARSGGSLVFLLHAGLYALLTVSMLWESIPACWRAKQWDPPVVVYPGLLRPRPSGQDLDVRE